MELLITKLESLVKTWNREDETITKAVFDDLNKDGVYFLQSDGSYVYIGKKWATGTTPQEEEVVHPSNGTAKIVSGDSMTIEVYKDSTLSTTEMLPAVKNRIMTNTLLNVIDSLKNIYVNEKGIRSVSEIFYRLKMAEYLYAVAGKNAKNIKWYAPTNDISNKDKFLATNGCYTFTMGTDANKCEFICGMIN
jgi:hypothetical protein